MSEPTEPGGSLAAAFSDLAVLPDDAPGLREALERVARAVVDRVPTVDYASVTARQDNRYTTVAMTSELALAVDEAQYADDAGPCLDAADGVVVGVADTATVIDWPRFRDVAVSLGLRSSLSVPLSTAGGAPSIALNLYAHRPAALMPLALAVTATYDLQRADDIMKWRVDLDDGSREFVDALDHALTLRSTIQIGIGVVMARDNVDASVAYLTLRLEAAEANRSIAVHAEAIAASPGFS